MSHAEHIRDVYVYFLRTGIANDGLAHGCEYTRHAPVRAPWDEPDAPQHSGERSEAPMDRYGFFDASATMARGAPAVLPASAYVKRGLRHPVARTPAPLGRRRMQRPPKAATVQRQRDALTRTADARERRRIHKWMHMLQGEEFHETLRAHVAPALVERRIFKGVPDDMRGQVWDVLSRAHGTRDVPAPHDMLEHASPHDGQIDLDVPRTVRGHTRFFTRYGRGQCELFSVLHALSLLCTECGYCQGMGPVAATLLLHAPAAQVLALLVRMHDAYGFHDIWRLGFPGLRAEFFALRELQRAFTPRASRALEAAGLAPSAYATGWLMTLFSGVLPYATHLRVLDMFFHGGRNVLLLVAVAMVRVLDVRLAHDAHLDLLEELSRPMLPEDDDALCLWVQRAMHAADVQACLSRARAAWAALVDHGTDAAEFV
ncbi:Similar to S.cerevisiae protein GYP5 (GTPase-activating protein (GAP) for yeast Rab family members) [Malassezia sympodialis ATCC 42132]|uniref:Similar to S.cerevisiae protein GYP5 (GTPase-activating protein (GAP) for yeast Rab family members) n=1 Tax=Malassezia sympodialis (strain ATCC 42132) TaxID=1230383 RepID=A0A1M8A9Z7_MALS4|nr:Similar to S.cerevisiae protein GYP5 (GTPase-activating protein (GAP) for yeast Rab family members) [Malassezia sympodialis ATCC 42132]